MTEKLTSRDMRSQLCDALFPAKLPTVEEIEKRYPPRNLPPGAKVTRIAPSPTGFMHLGGLYMATISERIAHQSGGVFYLRIEDTDKNREVPGATNLIIGSLINNGILLDEGPTQSGTDVGAYGPYIQSERAHIYQAYIKSLVAKGLAYPCFSTQEELEEMHQKQEDSSTRPGYYGKWATWRDKSDNEILKALHEGKQYVIRLKSQGNINNRIPVSDLVKGTRNLQENDQDVVILKSNGLPTYHVAHVIDDKLMGTTHVLRGDEWYASMPLHLQLFHTFGWEPPQYGHIAPIQKKDGVSIKKLSKRSDPEANLAFYEEAGYPSESLKEYLLHLANPNFENWRKANPHASNEQFPLKIERLEASNGAIFDMNKLQHVSREHIAGLSAEEIYDRTVAWAKQHDPDQALLLEQNKEYTINILNIERGFESKNNKAISKWSDVKKETEYFYDERFHLSPVDFKGAFPVGDQQEIQSIVSSFIASYNEGDTTDQWFDKMKGIATSYGYAESTKAFKAHPEDYKGSVGDITKIFRVLLTGNTKTPDLYSVMQVMGLDRVMRRLSVIFQ